MPIDRNRAGGTGGRRAAIYARYSSENEREASIEDQVRLCRERAEREGWEVTGVYSDSAISGTTDRRPGFQALIAELGRIDIIIAEALDRISRDQEHVAGFHKKVSFAGARLITLAEGEISELLVGLKGTMNAVFIKDLAAKTHRGQRGRVEAGRSAGGRAYGYRPTVEYDAQGERVRGGLAIEPAEAAIVNRIFRDFVAGHSPKAIARRLNADGIPGPSGGPWQDTTIRGHAARLTGILRNPRYGGRYVWNRLNYARNPMTGRRVSRLNPPELWQWADQPELRIVEAELWQQAQAKLGDIRNSPRSRRIRDTRFWEHRRPRHLLTGKLFCAACGSAYKSVGKDYLACGTANARGACTNRRSIRRADLEALILGAVRHNLMQPDCVKAFQEAYVEEVNRQRREASAGRDGMEKELAQVSRKLGRLIDAIAQGIRGAGLQQKLDELEDRKAALEAALAAPPPTPVRLHPNLAEVYREQVANLHAALADPALAVGGDRAAAGTRRPGQHRPRRSAGGRAPRASGRDGAPGGRRGRGHARGRAPLGRGLGRSEAFGQSGCGDPHLPRSDDLRAVGSSSQSRVELRMVSPHLPR